MEATETTDRPPASIEWVVEAADIVDASRTSQRGLWRAVRLATVSLIVVAVVAAAFGADVIIWLPLLGVGVYLFLYQTILYPRAVNRQSRSLIGQTVVTRVDANGLHVDRSGSHQWTEWAALSGIEDGAVSILILRPGMAAAGIPKRAFATPDDANAFVTYVQARLRNQRDTA